MNKIFRNLAIGLAILIAGPGLLSAQLPAGSALFGITFIGNQLVTVDPGTGVARTVGALGATAYAYGIGQRNGHLYTFDQVDNRIHEISKISGKFIRSIDVGLSGLKGEGDITFNAQGQGFLASALNANNQPVNDSYLITITEDADVGTAVRLGSSSVAIDAMAFANDGTLYGIGQAADAKLYRINTATGALTVVGPLGVPMNNPISGMASIDLPQPASANGVQVSRSLVASIDDRLYQIDPNTGAATPVSADIMDFGVSSVAGLVVAPGAGTLGNMAGRLNVGTDEKVGISGFIIRGTPDKTVVIRGIGPSLRNVPDMLANPMIELFDAQGQSIASNDDWRNGPDADQIQALGLAPSNDKEAALLRTLPAGNYTAVLSGVGRTGGIGLIELYDTDVGSGSRLANLSTRGFVGTGDSALIGGIIVRGSAAQRVVVRAIGPDLANRGVPNVLADPNLEIFDANGVSIKTNDNWMTDPDAAEISAQHLQPANDLEAATVVSFAPGNYTAVVRGKTPSATGVALVETFNLSTGE